MPETHPTNGRILFDRDTAVHLPSGLAARVLDVDGSLWEHTSQSAELRDGRILLVGDYTDTWGWWEKHPVGDEVVVVLAGEVELLLEDRDGRRALHLAPGEGTIIPAATWHRAVVHTQSRMLFITPTPVRTEHRDA